MTQADSILTGVQQLLFGNLRPGTVLEEYLHGDSGLFHTLYEVPRSPESYLQADPEVRERWDGKVDGEMMKEWTAPWYNLPGSIPESFHILCEFYRAFTRCECRMAVHTAESWRMNFSMGREELLYELLTLQGELVELLRECRKRIKISRTDGHSTQGRLTLFLATLLKNNLLMTLLEIQKRHGELLEGNIITEKQLYLKYLEQPVPDIYPWHGTTQLTLHELELACRPPGIQQKVKGLLIQQKKLRGRHMDESAQDEMYQSLAILENAWLITLAVPEHELNSAINTSGPDENARRIKHWAEALATDEGPEIVSHSKSMIEALLPQIPEIKATLSMGNPPQTSEAAKLINELEHLFTPAEEAKGMNNRPSESPANGKSKGHWLLQSYIPYNSVKEKFEIDYKTFKKYLRDSEIKVIEFSQKNRWLHKDDVKAFLETHQKLI